MRDASALILCSLLAAAAGAGETPAAGGKITCRGRVVGTAGKPLAGADVWAFELVYGPTGRTPRPIGRARTQADGAFAFAAGRPGNWGIGLIIARKKGLALGWQNWKMHQGDGLGAIITLGKPAALAGKVVDETGKPIAGATVRAALAVSGRQGNYVTGLDPLDWLIVRTDAAGAFGFSDVPSDATAELIVEAPGRAKVHTAGPARLEAWGQYAAGRTDIRIALPREARIEGTVVDTSNGQGVAGVKLLARAVGRGTFEWATAASASKGRFRLPGLRAGKYRVGLLPPESGEADWVGGRVVTVETTAGERAGGVKLLVAKGGLVEVRATDPQSNRAVAGASVSVVGIGRGGGHSATANAKGLARVRLMPGKYRLGHVSARGYVLKHSSGEAFTVTAGKTVRVVLRLVPAPRVRGVARDEAGRPVAGAEVRILPGSGAGGANTDAAGRFEAFAQDPWTLREGTTRVLLVRHERRGLAAVVELGAGDEPVQVRLAAGATVCGRVVDPNGRPIRNGQVVLRLRSSRWGYTVARYSPTDANGRYEIVAVPLGREYEIGISAEGYGRNESNLDLVDAAAGRAEHPQAVLKVADRSLSGVVVDAQGKPVAGARVNAHGYEQPHRSARTDKQGKFTLARLVEGPVRIHVYQSSTRLYRNVETRAGADGVKIVLAPGPIAEIPPAPPEPPPQVGKPLGKLDEVGVALAASKTRGKRLLVCFWDRQQRPSRHCIRQLAARADRLAKQGLLVICVHAPGQEAPVRGWLSENKVPFAAGVCPPEPDKKPQDRLAHRWGVRAWPWLILTDTDHVVRAEGLSLRGLEAKLTEARPE